MGVSGHYVTEFAAASHALPEGMHMNADYPFMLPAIVRVVGRRVTIRADAPSRLHAGEAAEQTVDIQKHRGREFFTLSQSSTWERLFKKPPSPYRFYPFKDFATPAAGVTDPQASLF